MLIELPEQLVSILNRWIPLKSGLVVVQNLGLLVRHGALKVHRPTVDPHCLIGEETLLDGVGEGLHSQHARGPVECSQPCSLQKVQIAVRVQA